MHYLKLTAVGFVCALSEAVVASKYPCVTSASFPLIWSSKYRERCKTSNPAPTYQQDPQALCLHR